MRGEANPSCEAGATVLAKVAQTLSLLYRRLAACGSQGDFQCPNARAPADWKSAIQQARGLRYEQANESAREGSQIAQPPVAAALFDLGKPAAQRVEQKDRC
jgi:hypothetical protein